MEFKKISSTSQRADPSLGAGEVAVSRRDPPRREMIQSGPSLSRRPNRQGEPLAQRTDVNSITPPSRKTW